MKEARPRTGRTSGSEVSQMRTSPRATATATRAAAAPSFRAGASNVDKDARRSIFQSVIVRAGACTDRWIVMAQTPSRTECVLLAQNRRRDEKEYPYRWGGSSTGLCVRAGLL